MEELEQSGFIGVADYIEGQDNWWAPEWKLLNSEFATVLVDNLLDFLWDYYMPL